MATKAELQAELEKLRAEMAEDKAPDTSTDASAPEPAKTTPLDGWTEMLKSHGLDATDTQALMTQLSDELGDLPKNKPLITAIAAFGVGFVLGRMSK
jgi:hypothetical protein